MAVSWELEGSGGSRLKGGKEGYRCPACNGSRNSYTNMQVSIVEPASLTGTNIDRWKGHCRPKGDCKARVAWLDRQLNEVQTCIVTHKGGSTTTLERDEEGNFWCLGCGGLGSPFPGTMQVQFTRLPYPFSVY